jgi:16S rRNA (guanine966-N2)-methyltransferase
METRPTSDKVREAIFGMLGEEVEDRSVLDLFAGTGALGIEALSRGAASAVFVERRPPACQIIRANLKHTKLEDLARVMCMPAERALTLLDESFGLVLLDPPYAYPDIPRILETLGGALVVGNDCIVVFEHSPRFAIQDRYGRLLLRRQRTYGDTAVAIFGVNGEENG